MASRELGRKSAECISHSYVGAARLCNGANEHGIRCFHASPEVWARTDDQAFGLKTLKKEKFVKKNKRNQLPVEAPYVARNLRKARELIPDKTIGIFEGLTLVELAKRSGKSVSSLQDILRSGEVVFEAPCASLKREKQDVDTVDKGNECGLVLQDWNDFQIGDVIQCLEQVVRKPKFIKSQSGAVRIEC